MRCACLRVLRTGLQNIRRPQLPPRRLYCSTPAITYHILLQRAAADDPMAGIAAALLTLVHKFGHRLSAKQQIRLLEHLAELGDAEAQFELGTSNALEQDERTRHLKLAADQGHVSANYTLALLYVSSDESRAVEGILVAAERINRAVKCMHVAADSVLTHSADAGHLEIGAGSDFSFTRASAKYELGVWYKKGQIVDRSPELAFRYFHDAADFGHTEAQYEVGLCYDGGFGVKRNEARATEYLVQAARQGCDPALYALESRGCVFPFGSSVGAP